VSYEARETYIPQFLDGSLHTPTGNDAYVRVRLTARAGPTGMATVYLPDGTALMVPGPDLIRLAPAEREIDQATALARNAGR
jgi:hypothetical protein